MWGAAWVTFLVKVSYNQAVCPGREENADLTPGGGGGDGWPHSLNVREAPSHSGSAQAAAPVYPKARSWPTPQPCGQSLIGKVRLQLVPPLWWSHVWLPVLMGASGGLYPPQRGDSSVIPMTTSDRCCGSETKRGPERRPECHEPKACFCSRARMCGGCCAAHMDNATT